MLVYKKGWQCQVVNLPEIYMNQFGYITNGSFVEIGAFNCYNWSNTYTLALAGWSGLLIEPQIELFNDCLKLYKDNPRITLRQCCVGRKNGKTKLYLGGSTSTIKEEMIDTYNGIEWAKFSGLDEDNFIWSEVYTLNNIFDEYKQSMGFEVLVIDVEGAELDVLAGFALDYWQPKMVIIEAHEQSEDARLSGKAIEINEYFRDYEKIYSDHINNIYVKQ